MPDKHSALDATLKLLLEEEDVMQAANAAKAKEEENRAEQEQTGVQVVADPLDNITPRVSRPELKRKMDHQLSQATHGNRSKYIRNQEGCQEEQQEQQQVVANNDNDDDANMLGEIGNDTEQADDMQ